jgi:hypothetical protein
MVPVNGRRAAGPPARSGIASPGPVLALLLVLLAAAMATVVSSTVRTPSASATTASAKATKTPTAKAPAALPQVSISDASMVRGPRHPPPEPIRQ